MRSAILPLCVLLALLPSAPEARAQAVDPDTPVSSEAPAAAQEAPQTVGAAERPFPAPAAGLPERAAPPRTLRAYWHVFVAFAVTWVLLFGYALTVGRRFGRLDDEVRRLSRVE